MMKIKILVCLIISVCLPTLYPVLFLFSASELVQRVHTLEFLHRDKLKEEFIMAYANRVKAHQYDDDSPEVISKYF